MCYEYMVVNSENEKEIIYRIQEMIVKIYKKYYIDRDNLELRVGVDIYSKLQPLNKIYYMYSGKKVECILGIEVQVNYDLRPNEILLKTKGKEIIIPKFNFLEAKVSNSTLPEKYIVNDKATILFWEDGTKTIVKKSKNDIFDPIKSYLWAYFQKHSGMTKTQANKYLAEINDNN